MATYGDSLRTTYGDGLFVDQLIKLRFGKSRDRTQPPCSMNPIGRRAKLAHVYRFFFVFFFCLRLKLSLRSVSFAFDHPQAYNKTFHDFLFGNKANPMTEVETESSVKTRTEIGVQHFQSSCALRSYTLPILIGIDTFYLASGIKAQRLKFKAYHSSIGLKISPLTMAIYPRPMFKGSL
ncbi:hypothetical protein K435DRAFT_344709 [Dendrothele bispora CBS 962.96]|uniref:Uncharacterized protein n=1 Tax=Dendrothele bispora (strain CBS 962.96) TaxID=1314807 RepID=A0A4S8MJD4_DENBC|nr:hypothetical protein K435DRAFT_344709 [Dendrothele bispora CBS 962.96]